MAREVARGLDAATSGLAVLVTDPTVAAGACATADAGTGGWPAQAPAVRLAHAPPGGGAAPLVRPPSPPRGVLRGSAASPAEAGGAPATTAIGVPGATAAPAMPPDLLAWSAKGIALYAAGATAVAPSGLEGLAGVIDAAPGDFDNDGRADLAVITAARAALYRNVGRRVEKVSVALPAGHFRKAVWLDYDHDYDLDLLLLGHRAALVRNPGGGLLDGWTDRTADFPFVAGEAVAAATLHAVSDTQGIDLAVAYADRPGVLYRDRLGGKFEAEPLPVLPAMARAEPASPP